MESFKRKMKAIVVFGITCLLSAACKKTAPNLRHSFSGIYAVEDVKMEYFSENGTLDSIVSFKNIGTVTLLDQDSKEENAFIIYFDDKEGYPLLFRRVNNNIPLFYFWNIDGNNKSRLFFTGDPGDYLIYTVLKKSNSQLKIQRININQNNDILYRETITFQKL
jgi:hypothetical protein